MSIERFDVSSCGNRNCDPLLIEDDGVYVYYDEYAKLKAENERLERNRDMWKDQVERQAEELTSLRKDAERYRWLRSSDWCVGSDDFYCSEGGSMENYSNENFSPDDLDATIDAAISYPENH